MLIHLNGEWGYHRLQAHTMLSMHQSDDGLLQLHFALGWKRNFWVQEQQRRLHHSDSVLGGQAQLQQNLTTVAAKGEPAILHELADAAI